MPGGTVARVCSKTNRARREAGAVLCLQVLRTPQPIAFGQVFLIQSAAAVDSL
jgi:hypothetical protein